MGNNRYGVCEWVLPASGVDAVQFAAGVGFDGIQLGDAGGAKESFPLNRASVQQQYIEAAERYGIAFQGLHLYTLVREGTMKYPFSTSEGEAGWNSIMKGISACAAMKIPQLFLTSGMACQIENEDEFLNTAEMFKRACEVGADHGVSIVFESILTVEEILRMIDIAGEGLKVCYDIYNPIRFGTASPLDEILPLAGVIDHYHLKDAPFDNVGCTFFGEGMGDFHKTAELIKSTGYTGWFVSENYYALEPFNQKGEPADLAKQDLATMRRVFG